MPIITMLTDFGTTDPYVGELRGVLLSRAPGVTLVDLTHDLSPGNIPAAAYILGRAWTQFPDDTIHLVVVDPGVGTRRRAIAFELSTHMFVGPDNGVFSTLPGLERATVVELPILESAAPTFHGRDVFAPAAAALACGKALSTLGPPFEGSLVRFQTAAVRRDEMKVTGVVVYVDRFGNLLTNLTGSDVAGCTGIEVSGQTAGPVRNTFGDVPPGGSVVYVGSGGTVEIAVREGSAARRFDAGVGSRVRAVFA